MTEVRLSQQSRRTRMTAFAIIGAVGVIFAILALLRLTRFDMTAFDAGIFDNVLWRLGNGFDDVTDITGSHHFSDHMSLLMLALVPVYALVPDLGLPVLIVAQAASVALVAAAAWLLADHLELDAGTKRAVLLVTLVGAGSFNAALIDVHEVGLAVGPLAMTAVLGIRGSSLRSYWIWPVLAASARLDIAVSVIIVGLLLRHDRPRHARVAVGIGAGFAAAMLAWLLLNPWDGTSFAFHFGHLGIDSASELPGAMLRDPVTALEPLLDPTMWGTILVWFAGFMALIPLRAAKWILPALPTVIIPVFGSWPQADESHLHYWHVLLPMLSIAMVIGLARTPALGDRVLYLAVGSVALTWIFMPIFKPTFGDDLSDERSVVAYLEQQPDASLAVEAMLVPHVSRRPSVMQLPTPFSCPTRPIASFVGPNQPPELVAVSTALLEQRPTDAVATMADTIEMYYERIEVFGVIEVWELTGEMPSQAVGISCGVAASANSS